MEGCGVSKLFKQINGGSLFSSKLPSHEKETEKLEQREFEQTRNDDGDHLTAKMLFVMSFSSVSLFLTANCYCDGRGEFD